MKSWEELDEDSKRHSKQSKPEILAIMEILSYKNPMSLTQIHEIFASKYNHKTTLRQIRYYVEIMKENKSIEEDKDNKTYSLIEDNKASIIYKSLTILLIISFFSFVLFKSNYALLVFMTLTVIIVIIHTEIEFLNKTKKKIFFIK